MIPFKDLHTFICGASLSCFLTLNYCELVRLTFLLKYTMSAVHTSIGFLSFYC